MAFGLFLQVCWWVAAPALILAIWLFSMADYQEPTYNNGQYVCPPWAIGLGWLLALLSLLTIPVCAAVAVLKAAGSLSSEHPWLVCVSIPLAP